MELLRLESCWTTDSTVAGVLTYLEVLKGSASVVTSVGEGPESPEEQQKIVSFLHPEMTEKSLVDLQINYELLYHKLFNCWLKE